MKKKQIIKNDLASPSEGDLSSRSFLGIPRASGENAFPSNVLGTDFAIVRNEKVGSERRIDLLEAPRNAEDLGATWRVDSGGVEKGRRLEKEGNLQ